MAVKEKCKVSINCYVRSWLVRTKRGGVVLGLGCWMKQSRRGGFARMERRRGLLVFQDETSNG